MECGNTCSTSTSKATRLMRPLPRRWPNWRRGHPSSRCSAPIQWPRSEVSGMNDRLKHAAVASRAPAHIRAISPYQPGKPISELAREMGLAEGDIVKLASNENPLGMSDAAHKAAAFALEDFARYPDGNGFELKAALSAKLGVGLDQIVLGNGSNDILELAARALLSPDASAVYAQYAFAVYPLATNAAGACGIEVAARDFGHDLDAMAAAITPQT